jgi:hypothetical protein
VSIDQNYVFQPKEWHRIRNLDIDNISWVQHEVPKSRYRDVVRCYCNIRLGRWGGKGYVTFRKTRNEVSNNLYDDMGVATAFTKLFLILYSVINCLYVFHLQFQLDSMPTPTGKSRWD